ncbi:unnamed protein product, partial [Hapterophycus canaliculatus]
FLLHRRRSPCLAWAGVLRPRVALWNCLELHETRRREDRRLVLHARSQHVNGRLQTRLETLGRCRTDTVDTRTVPCTGFAHDNKKRDSPGVETTGPTSNCR